MALPFNQVLPAAWTQHLLEIDIDALPARVWKAITEETDAWWLPDFRMSPGCRRVVLEPRVGGRWYEDAGEGAGLLWAIVIALDPGKSMHFAGWIAPPWSVASCLMHMALEARGGATRLTVTSAQIGAVDADSAAEIESGWKLLFTDGLKKHAERAR